MRNGASVTNPADIPASTSVEETYQFVGDRIVLLRSRLLKTDTNTYTFVSPATR